MSNLNNPGEWENRRISIIGVAKSFISQLSVGQDLTKISLPAVFQYPYSALELGGHKSLSYCHLLYGANREQDEFKRFLFAVRWLLSATQKEKYEKKPYNPILGECHYAWTESEEFGPTRYLAEQTTHHPPLCAFVMENQKERMLMQGNLTFDIKFHGNSVSVIASGPTRMDLGDDQYLFSAALPNLSIKNVIIGTKRISWDGEIVITCPKSNYKTSMIFREEGWYCTNVVNGTICKLDKPDVPLYTFYGPCGGKIEMTNCATNAKEVLFDTENERRCRVNYPPLSVLDDRCSLRLWTEVNHAIIVDDMEKADLSKRKVEEAQRKRRAEGTNFEPRFFGLNTETSFWDSKVEAFHSYTDGLMTTISQLPNETAQVTQVETQLASVSLEEKKVEGEYVPSEL